jgi:hypothetical protein
MLSARSNYAASSSPRLSKSRTTNLGRQTTHDKHCKRRPLPPPNTYNSVTAPPMSQFGLLKPWGATRFLPSGTRVGEDPFGGGNLVFVRPHQRPHRCRLVVMLVVGCMAAAFVVTACAVLWRNDHGTHNPAIKLVSRSESIQNAVFLALGIAAVLLGIHLVIGKVRSMPQRAE